MGDNSTNSPVTPESEVAKSADGNHPKRNPSTSSRRPNYLRASTGSCHDFCKFGKVHSVECKPRIPLQRRAASKSADDQVFARNAASLPEINQRALALRSKSFPTPKSYDLEDISNVRKEKLLQLDRTKTVLLSGLRLAKDKKDTSVSKPSSSNLRKPLNKGRPVVIETFKRVVPQTKQRRLSGTPILSMKSVYVATRHVSSNPFSVDKVGESKEDVQKKNKCLSSSSTSSLHTRRSIPSKKPATASLTSKLIMGKRGIIKSVDPRLSAGKRLIPKEANKEKNATKNAVVDTLDKAADVLENEEESKSLPGETELVVDQDQIENDFRVYTEIPVTTMSLPNSPAISFQEEDQMENDSTYSEVSVSASHCQMNSSSLAVSMEEEKEEELMENENGLETSSTSEIPESPSQPEEEYETEVQSSSLSGTAEYSFSDLEENEEILPEGETWAARSRAVGAEEAKPVKLQFRRGKVLDLQSESNNAPRRLTFRRVQMTGENQDANAIALKKIMDRGWFDGGGDGSLDRSANVVLRHSDHQVKKEAQASLLNNVIEETASKLVETRKSKVKALVGAFETVMSLRDTKPVGNGRS